MVDAPWRAFGSRARFFVASDPAQALLRVDSPPMPFAWDARKAALNLRKHRVSFEEARSVFDDTEALVQADVAHPDRLVILGMSLQARVLLVVYAEFDGSEVIRLISARKATKREEKVYRGE
jgi:uncharacterized DUF497 family protein